MTEYRWGRASGGEIPPEAVAEGHGWEYDTKDGPNVRMPVWLARSLPDTSGSVRVCRVRPGYGAALYHREFNSRVDEYEVLLDAGTWIWPDGDDYGVPMRPANAVAVGCGQNDEPIYAALDIADDDEPAIPYDFALGEDNRCKVLVDPDLPARPMVGQPREEDEEDESGAPAGPCAAIQWLDCKNEVVLIANHGDEELDLGGWRLHDDSSRKAYVFPPGTKLRAGASVRVRSGPGAATPGPGELAWKTSSVWNDRGDTAFLEDPAGMVVSSRKG